MTNHVDHATTSDCERAAVPGLVPCDDAAVSRAERAISDAHLNDPDVSYRALAQAALRAAGETP